MTWCSKDKKRDEKLACRPFLHCNFFNHVLKTSNNKGALTTAFYGIRLGHHINGFLSPIIPFVQMAFEGALRSCNKKPKAPKKTITPEFKKMLILNFESTTLPNLRFLLLCSLDIFGFFSNQRIAKYSVKTHHYIRHSFVQQAKNDQHRDGKNV